MNRSKIPSIVSFLCLLLVGVAGRDPVQVVRKMREKDRQLQKENNARQIEKALENYNQMYEGVENADEPSNDSSKP